MSNKNPSETRPVQRAQGLDPEITAQPKPIADELAFEASAEPELTVDADELGSRFLREATEQGDFDPERVWPGETSLFESPAGDEPLAGTNFVAGNSPWEQTVDLETRTQGAADMLREPPPLLAAEWDEALGADEDQPGISESSVRELSLLDEQDEPTEEIMLEQQGSHTRKAAQQNFGQERPSPKANPQGKTGRENNMRATGIVPTALRQCAAVLRYLANHLQQRTSSARAPRVPSGHAPPSDRAPESRMERKLDEAIEMTFPASDPISI